jgi:hypothetical protein
MKRDCGREVCVAALDRPHDCLPLKHRSPSYLEEMFAFPQMRFAIMVRMACSVHGVREESSRMDT